MRSRKNTLKKLCGLRPNNWYLSLPSSLLLVSPFSLLFPFLSQEAIAPQGEDVEKVLEETLSISVRCSLPFSLPFLVNQQAAKLCLAFSAPVFLLSHIFSQKSLGLQPGANVITFSVTSTLQGTREVTARIFLWDTNAKIVVSDIDGTITKYPPSPLFLPPLCLR